MSLRLCLARPAEESAASGSAAGRLRADAPAALAGRGGLDVADELAGGFGLRVLRGIRLDIQAWGWSRGCSGLVFALRLDGLVFAFGVLGFDRSTRLCKILRIYLGNDKQTLEVTSPCSRSYPPLF